MLKLDINLVPSKLFTTVIALIFLCSAVVVMTLTMILFAKLCLIFLSAAYSAYIIFYYGLLKSQKSILKISLSPDGWTIWDKHRVHAAELCGSSTITRIVCVLRFKILSERSKRSCLVLKNSLDPNLYRKLLMNIRN
jgi:hypothetical protein